MYDKHPTRPITLASNDLWNEILLACRIGDQMKFEISRLMEIDRAEAEEEDPNFEWDETTTDRLYYETVLRIFGADYYSERPFELTRFAQYIYLHLISMASGRDRFQDYLRGFKS